MGLEVADRAGEIGVGGFIFQETGDLVERAIY